MKQEFLIQYARIILFVIANLDEDNYLEERPSVTEVAHLVMLVFNAVFNSGMFALEATIDECTEAVKTEEARARSRRLVPKRGESD